VVQGDPIALHDTTIALDGITLALHDVVALPIWSGSGEHRRGVGLVYEGDATATYELGDHRTWTANLLHRAGRTDEATAIAAGGAFTTKAERGVLVGAHPALHAVLDAQESTGSPDAAPFSRLEASPLATAWRGRVLLDRIGIEHLGWPADVAFTVVDLDTGTPLGDNHDGWLTWVSDPMGEASGWKWRVHGTHRTGNQIGHTTLFGARWKPVGIPTARPQSAALRVDATPAPDRGLVDLEFTAELHVTAVDGPLRGWLLRVPRFEGLRGAFEISEVDGEWVDLRNGLILVLPDEPVAEGQTTQTTIRWRDSWWLTLGQVGATTGQHMAIPAPVPSQHGNPWSFRLTTSVPFEGTRDGNGRTVAVASGDAVAAWIDDERSWVTTEATEPGRWAAVGFGRFASAHLDGTPTIDVHRLSTGAEAYATAAAEIVTHYEGRYGPWPHAGLTVVEEPPTLMVGAWWASHALVAVRSIWSPWTHTTADWVSVGLAHEIAHQYWGQQLAPTNDRVHWYVEGMAEYARCEWAVSSGRDGCDGWLSQIQREVQRRPHTSPTRTGSYGVRVLSLATLERRIGPQAFARGTAALLASDTPVDDVAVRTAYQHASGIDLEGWWEFWIEGGWLPKLRMRWRRTGSTITARVTSDVPYGRFEVPVVIEQKRRAVRRVWVEIEDGEGTVEIEGLPPGRLRARLDPNHLILARTRRARRGG
jgi:hypothetical protein